MAPLPERLKEIEGLARKGETPKSTPRELLAWFDAQRRGVWIVHQIRKALEDLHLATVPDFQSAYIDEPIAFCLARKEPSTGSAEAQPTDGRPPATGDTPEPGAVPPGVSCVGISADPTHRIGRLASANRAPAYVSPDAALREAVTLMLAKDFSQLPVMTSLREVKGMISWRSIGSRFSMGSDGQAVRDFMEEHREVTKETSMFEAIALISKHDCVLVRDAEKRICGIVTTADLSDQFGQLSEPFLILGDIENCIRSFLDGRFTVEELGSVRDEGDTEREIGSVHDLTFGEYLRLIENPDRWDKLCLHVHRKVFTKQLDRVRVIRNEVVHFDPDGIAPDDLQTLREFAAFLHRLHRLGAQVAVARDTQLEGGPDA